MIPVELLHLCFGIPPEFKACVLPGVSESKASTCDQIVRVAGKVASLLKKNRRWAATGCEGVVECQPLKLQKIKLHALRNLQPQNLQVGTLWKVRQTQEKRAAQFAQARRAERLEAQC